MVKRISQLKTVGLVAISLVIITLFAVVLIGLVRQSQEAAERQRQQAQPHELQEQKTEKEIEAFLQKVTKEAEQRGKMTDETKKEIELTKRVFKEQKEAQSLLEKLVAETPKCSEMSLRIAKGPRTSELMKEADDLLAATNKTFEDLDKLLKVFGEDAKLLTPKEELTIQTHIIVIKQGMEKARPHRDILRDMLNSIRKLDVK